MKIGEVERITGLTSKAIRLYEEKGLIRVERKENSYREYDAETVKKLQFIKTLRELDIPISKICLHLNGVISAEEMLLDRQKELEKERAFRQDSYKKCMQLLRQLKLEETKENAETYQVYRECVLLGIDIGTTNISAAVLDYEREELMESYVISNASALPCEKDFSEFDAEWIYQKAKRMLDYLLKAYPNTRGIGVTGQMHGVVCLSEEGKAISPFYNWQDGRGNRNFEEGKTYCDEILERTGYICNAGYAFTTLFYNARNHLLPREMKSFCGIADYIVMRLTGRKVPLLHPSDAAAFGLYATKKNAFDREAVKKLGLDWIRLPEVATGEDIAGTYCGIPIALAIGDNQASFFGSVREEESTALVNFGTGSQVSIAAERILDMDESIEVRPYLFGKYLLCGSALCGGKAYAVVERFFSEYASTLTGQWESQYERMNQLAEHAYQKGKPLTVSTLFCGTRRDVNLRGSIDGIGDTDFTPGNLILGVLFGMAEELRGYFLHMEHSNIWKLAASGNAVQKNRVLQKVLRDVFEREVVLTQNEEEAATGCALYAGVIASVITKERAKNFIREE